ncbi:restriction endonuclease subunit S [Lederbergia citrisecunda]|uniref:restriction endonuclease subunit S n=1 Tax=Lederbergia citrisecunda TaxID=2833583 RepID=UPI003D266076
MKIEGYIDSIFGPIPQEWKVTTLDAITLEHKQGFYTKEKYQDEGVKLIRITDLGNPKIDYRQMPLLKMSDKDYEDFKVEKGDFLFARSGAIGRYGIVEDEDEKAVFASYIIRFRFNNEQLLNKYVGYFYESSFVQRQLSAITQGSSNVNINANNIKSLKVTLPTINEQQKIVEILSSVDEQIEATEQLIAETKELKQGLMQKLLTKGIGHTDFKQSDLGDIPVNWQVRSLSDIGIWHGGSTPSKSKAENWAQSKEIAWVTSKDMHTQVLEETEIYITEIGMKEKNLSLLPIDTLVFVTRSGILRKRVPVAITAIETTINQDQKALLCNENAYSRFVLYVIQRFNNHIKDTYVKTGTTVESIDFSGFKDYKLALPPFEEQQKIANILSSVDDQIEIYEQEKEEFEQLKRGLMQKLLTGEIRVSIEEVSV